jgi:hypothetical protein
MPILKVIEWIRKCSLLYQSNPNDVIIITKATCYILKEISFFERKSRTSDHGREQVINENDWFLHFMKIISLCLDKLKFDIQRFWNVDEVGIQLTERNIRLMTNREYLNKDSRLAPQNSLTLNTRLVSNGIY